MGKLIDMTGRRFGRLTAISMVKRDGDSRAYWRCFCDCGTETVTSGKYLRSGNTRSCGCLAVDRARDMGSNREFVSKRAATITKHGHKRRGKASPEYQTWLAIKSRCSRPLNKDYPDYGGRGIRVSPEWEASFEQFLSDMGQRPTFEHQIDRMDPNGDYEASNCRWVTPTVQREENKRNLISVTVDGMTFHSLRAACRHFGVNVTAVHYRINTGIPVSEALKVGRWEGKPRRTRESYLPKSHPDRQ